MTCDSAVLGQVSMTQVCISNSMHLTAAVHSCPLTDYARRELQQQML